MPCYCSTCLGLKDFRRRRTIQDHLTADEHALQSCPLHRVELRAHYAACIERNQRFLSTNVPIVLDQDTGAANEDGTHSASRRTSVGSGDGNNLSEWNNAYDLMDLDLHASGSQDGPLDVQMNMDQSAQDPSISSSIDTDSDSSEDTEDEFSQVWWNQDDNGEEIENEDGEETENKDDDEEDISETPAALPSSANPTPVPRRRGFLEIPASVTELRDELCGDYRVPSAPPQGTPAGPRELSPSEYWTLKHYTAWLLSNGTVAAYKAHASNLQESAGVEILEYRQAEKLAQRLVNFYPQTVDMCPYSCIAYTGGYEGLERCPEKRRKDPEKRTKTLCDEPRYRTSSKGQLKPRAVVQILSPFPRIRAMFARADTNVLIRKRDACLQQALHAVGTAITKKTYSDFADSQVHEIHHTKMGLFQDPRDIAFALSTDGAQLTMKKQSNTWLMILMMLNLPASIRYESGNVMIVFATPGPHSPIDVESFLWTLFKDMAMASEGIWMWDAVESSYFVHRAHVVMGLGDMLGSAKLSGMAGHNAVHGDRFTHVQGARSSIQPNAKYQYYPISPPENNRYNPERPAKYDLLNLPIRTQESYWDALESLDNAHTKTRREAITRSTGISRRPLCAGSAAFLHPTFFPLDPFHLFYENCMAYIWDLWTTISKPGEIVHLTAEKAAEVGRLIPDAMSTLPPTFCGPVRDVNLKRQSQFKVYEWMALLHWYLVPIAVELKFDPMVLSNFARFVEIIEYAMTNRPRTNDDLDALRSRIASFLQGFERLYVANNPDNISRSRLCIFQLIHVPHHIKWNGSVRLGSQATVERRIGEMGHKIRSRKAPFANLSNLIFRRELLKVVALYYPELQAHRNPSTGQSHNPSPSSNFMQQHRIAWTKLDQNAQLRTDINAISDYLKIDVIARRSSNPDFKIARWGKYKLPNGRFLSSQLSGERSTPTRRSEWMEIARQDTNFNSHRFPSQFGHVRAFYQVCFPDDSFRSLVVYTPLDNVENILNFPRGEWNGASLCVRDVHEIRDLVGIWSGINTGRVYILRKHPGLEMLSAEECGLEGIGADEVGEDEDDVDL